MPGLAGSALSGTAPKHRPVLPPSGKTGCPWRAASATTAATSCVVAGDTTASAAPFLRPRQSVRNGSISFPPARRPLSPTMFARASSMSRASPQATLAASACCAAVSSRASVCAPGSISGSRTPPTGMPASAM